MQYGVILFGGINHNNYFKILIRRASGNRALFLCNFIYYGIFVIVYQLLQGVYDKINCKFVDV